jgi:hypothetical protein
MAIQDLYHNSPFRKNTTSWIKWTPRSRIHRQPANLQSIIGPPLGFSTLNKPAMPDSWGAAKLALTASVDGSRTWSPSMCTYILQRPRQRENKLISRLGLLRTAINKYRLQQSSMHAEQKLNSELRRRCFVERTSQELGAPALDRQKQWRRSRSKKLSFYYQGKWRKWFIPCTDLPCMPSDSLTQFYALRSVLPVHSVS